MSFAFLCHRALFYVCVASRRHSPSEVGPGLQTMRTGGRRVPDSDNGLGRVLGERQTRP